MTMFSERVVLGRNRGKSMNREETKKAIEVMQAYVDGAEIEWRCEFSNSDYSDWESIDEPNWIHDGEHLFRIKPKPREWWLNTTSSECYVTKECAEKFSGGREVVWVREVL